MKKLSRTALKIIGAVLFGLFSFVGLINVFSPAPGDSILQNILMTLAFLVVTVLLVRSIVKSSKASKDFKSISRPASQVSPSSTGSVPLSKVTPSHKETSWDMWDISVHEHDGQSTRMERALSQNISIMSVSARGVSSIRGTTGEIYKTTFGSCSCKDFERRQLPCKHMYAYAVKYADFDPMPFIIRSGVSPHPLRGYMNMGLFQVSGKHQETHRTRTRAVYALDEAGALNAAHAEGLLDPVSVSEKIQPDPFDFDLEEAASHGIFIPDGAKAPDVSAALQRFKDNDPKTVTLNQFQTAASQAIPLSALAGTTYARDLLRNKKDV